MAVTRRQMLQMAGLWTGASAVRWLRQSPLGLFGLPRLQASPRVENSFGPLAVCFVDVARAAGLVHKTIFGGVDRNLYLLETTGCGAAFFDYDNDGWLDIFMVNGTRLEGFPKGQEPTIHLYKNNRDGTFTDVTEKAGLIHSGWGQGCCIGDYDNDGCDDLFVTYFGKNVLYHNNGDGTFTNVSERVGVAGPLCEGQLLRPMILPDIVGSTARESRACAGPMRPRHEPVP